MGPAPTPLVRQAPFMRVPTRPILEGMNASTPTSRGPVLSAPAVLSRAVVLTVLAGFIGVVYLVLPVGLGALFGTRASTSLSVAATAIVAMGFARVRTA